MRDVMLGFTMFVAGKDHGIDTEVVKLMMPKSVTQEYRGGGMDLGINQPMAALEPIEIGIKFSGLNTDIAAMIGQQPGMKIRTTFRLAVKDKANGNVIPHVAVVEGEFNGDSTDDLQRGEKAGFDALIQGVSYYKRMAGTQIIHHLQAYPPKRIINGVDHLEQVNNALGY
ncbi:Phage tail tube protein FII [Pseudovibrio axinellae]|uniref:Phage tail tube protein FII n=1 Tax=Pseudovibrio axinellae TaxID=989403 RepID=A0A165XH78_9HYPH|nr:phage major tail tube protein [Pseudovibrio axinellae]KZL17699.1 Phage tail tube protein FII [Pseudovibrio axinellae]SER43137.1 phage contractile tail tube protein, P2 family [Pseudovibrio axinellae]